MALTSCKNCGKEVKADAPTCPHCGADFHIHKRKTYKNVIVWLLIIFNLLMIAWAFFGLGGAGESIDATNTPGGENIARESTIMGSGMVYTIWIIGDVVLLALWFMAFRRK